MEFLVLRDDNNCPAFLSDQQAVVIRYFERTAIRRANGKRFERRRVAGFSNGVDCHRVTFTLLGWGSSSPLSLFCLFGCIPSQQG